MLLELEIKTESTTKTIRSDGNGEGKKYFEEAMKEFCTIKGLCPADASCDKSSKPLPKCTEPENCETCPKCPEPEKCETCPKCPTEKVNVINNISEYVKVLLRVTDDVFSRTYESVLETTVWVY